MNYTYKVKKLLRKPVAWYRRKKEKDADGFWRAALELHSYSQALYDYAAHKIKDPKMMFDVPLKDNSVILDLGGYKGEWTDMVLSLGVKPFILVYEPHPHLAKFLRNKYKDLDKVRPKEYGLSDGDYTTTFHIADQGSSEFDVAKETFNSTQSVNVIMKDVSKEIDHIKNIDIIKINIEGGEYPVLERLIETGGIEKINYVFVQFHEWIPKSYSRRNKIIENLKKTHTCEWSYYFVWEKWVRKT